MTLMNSFLAYSHIAFYRYIPARITRQAKFSDCVRGQPSTSQRQALLFERIQHFIHELTTGKGCQVIPYFKNRFRGLSRSFWLDSRSGDFRAILEISSLENTRMEGIG